MDFKPDIKPPDGKDDNGWGFVFCDDRIVVSQPRQDAVQPYFTAMDQLPGAPIHTHYLGTFEDRPCCAVALHPELSFSNGLYSLDLRSLLGVIDDDLLALAGRARHLIGWSLNHQFCGRCGNPLLDKSDERAKRCNHCGLVNYPRISPAVIVAVIRDHRILLARSRRIKRLRKSFYSVLAGFVETGETLEECVRREISEEVGISVKNIRYFGSQPWPFPDQLMVGFTAEYAAGEIQVDPKEIVDAGWFDAHNLPLVPGKWSIARRLIDWYVDSTPSA